MISLTFSLLMAYNSFAQINNAVKFKSGYEQPPNIVFVMFDDLGYSDVSFNGGLIPTKHIDSLREESIHLEKHYIHFVCSISRSQFLTGRYAMYSGYGKMHTFGPGNIGGIPVGQPTIAQWLKEYAHYNTYGVGKWHVGYATDDLLPHSHGFDHFFGFYTHAIQYTTFIYSTPKDCGCNEQRYDFHDDGRDYTELYSLIAANTDNSLNAMYLYRDRILENIKTEAQSSVEGEDNPFFMYLPLQSPHGPLEVIPTYHTKCKHLFPAAEIHSLKYCEILLMSDDIIGEIVNELKINNLWQNTLFVMTTDNGGDIENDASNWPLRGTKGSLFEGNQRVIATIGGGVIPSAHYGKTRSAIFSALDWTPTLLRFAGVYKQIAAEDRTWDGINQYDLIMRGDDYQLRDHLVLNIGLRSLESAAVVFKYPSDNDKLYKYIALDSDIDVLKRTDGWSINDYENNKIVFVSDDPNVNSDLSPLSESSEDNKYLFNLIDDIAEENNLLLGSEYDAILSYAKSLFEPYLKHPLYSQNIKCLWNYQSEEDMTDEGILFTDPWMEEQDYFAYIQTCIQKEGHTGNDIPNALSELYLSKWSAPPNKVNIVTDDETGNARILPVQIFNIITEEQSNYVYLIAIAVFVCAIWMYGVIKKHSIKKKNKDYIGLVSYGSV